MISVIIPTFNHAHTLRLCLDSIARQTLRNVEIVVVDDASTDDTADVLRKSIADGLTIILVRHDINRGANAARNAGFSASTGEYVLFCDADSILAPDALEKLLDALVQNPTASYAYSSFMFGWKTFKVGPFDSKKLRQMSCIHTTSLIRREHFPGFDQSIKRFQDWDLYLTMLEQGHTGAWVPEVLFRVVNTKGTMSRWLPSFMYQIPWLPAVKKYRAAEAIIRTKHHLDRKN